MGRGSRRSALMPIGVLAAAPLTLAAAVLGARSSALIAIGLLGLGYVLLARWQRALAAAAIIGVAVQIIVPVAIVSDYGQLKYVPIYPVVLGLIAAARSRGRVRWHRGPILLWAAMMLAYAAPTYLLGTSYEQRLWLASFAASTVLVAVVGVLDEKRRLAFYRAIVALAAVEAVYAWREFAAAGQLKPLWVSQSTHPDATGILNPVTNNGATRAQGTLGHPLPLGVLLLIALIIVWMTPAVRRRWLRAVLVAGFAFDIVFACGDRSVALVGGLILIFFVGGRQATSLGRFFRGLPLLIVALVVLDGLGVFQSRAVQQLFEGNDITHRSASLQSIPYLVGRQSLMSTVFGNGFDSAARLFTTGRLPPADAVAAIDNQFISTFAMSGLIGLLFTAWLIVVAYRRGQGVSRVILLVVVGTFFSFDVCIWPSTLTLFAAAVGLCYSEPRQDAASTARRGALPEADHVCDEGRAPAVVALPD